MADPADERTSFREAMERAEAAAGISRDDLGNEVVLEETPDTPTAEPIVASDLEVTEPVVEETQETSEEEVPALPETLTVDQLQKKLEIAEARLTEKDSFINRQADEVGQTRKEIEELRARIDLQESKVSPPPPGQFIELPEELLYENPGKAAGIAAGPWGVPGQV